MVKLPTIDFRGHFRKSSVPVSALEDRFLVEIEMFRLDEYLSSMLGIVSPFRFGLCPLCGLRPGIERIGERYRLLSDCPKQKVKK